MTAGELLAAALPEDLSETNGNNQAVTLQGKHCGNSRHSGRVRKEPVDRAMTPAATPPGAGVLLPADCFDGATPSLLEMQWTN